MPPDIIKFLFVDSQLEADADLRLSLDEDIKKLLEAAENEAKLEVKAEPLVKVLKDVLDLKDAEFQITPDGVKVNLDDQDRYNYFRQQLNSPDIVAKLAELGWVLFYGGDKNSMQEPPCWQLKFLALSTADTDPASITKEIGAGTDQAKWDAYMRKAGEAGLGKPVPDEELKYGPDDIPDPKTTRTGKE